MMETINIRLERFIVKCQHGKLGQIHVLEGDSGRGKPKFKA